MHSTAPVRVARPGPSAPDSPRKGIRTAVIGAFCAALPCLAAFADGPPPHPCCDQPLFINEIRVTDPLPGDPQEYFELRGVPGFPLDCYFYIVLGPGGIVEEVVPLAGHSINPSGRFLVAQPTFNAGLFPGTPTPDMLIPLNFHHTSNRTHLLVCACDEPVIVPGMDLDQEDTGEIDVPPWTCVVDCIALVQDPDGPPVYCPVSRGPTMSGQHPPHVFRCRIPMVHWAPWRIGMGPLPSGGGLDTPDLINPLCPPAMTFGGIPVSSVGDATVTASDDALLITGITPGGSGGALFELGAASSLSIGTVLPAALFAPECSSDDGSDIIWLLDLQADGMPVANFGMGCPGSLGIPNDPSFAITASVADVTLLALRVYQCNDLVQEFPGLPSGNIQVLVEVPAPSSSDIIAVSEWYRDPPMTLAVEFSASMTFHVQLPGLAGIPAITGTRLEFVALGGLPAPPVTTATVLAYDTANLEITTATLGMFGNRHHALPATGDVESGEVVIEGIAFGGDPLELITQSNMQVLDPFGIMIDSPILMQTSSGMISGIMINMPPPFANTPDGSQLQFEFALADAQPATCSAGGQINLGGLTLQRLTLHDMLLTADLTESDFPVPGIETIFRHEGNDVHSSFSIGSIVSTAITVPLTDVWPIITKVEVDREANRIYMRKCMTFPIMSIFGLIDEIVYCAELNIDPDPLPGGGRLLTSLTASGGLTTFSITGETAVYAPPPCPTDLDGDGSSGLGDLLLLLSQWGPCIGCPSDLNNDGTTDLLDLLVLLSSWGPCE